MVHRRMEQTKRTTKQGTKEARTSGKIFRGKKGNEGGPNERTKSCAITIVEQKKRADEQRTSQRNSWNEKRNGRTTDGCYGGTGGYEVGG